MRTVDLNCDMGESFGAWQMGTDAELMQYVSSVNIACGFHAGDSSTILQTCRMAVENGVAVGAHPSFPDLQGFGRRSMTLSPNEVYDIVLYQVSAVKGICMVLGGNLRHVKPHGALYNQAAQDKNLAKAIAEACKSIDRNIILYGLSGSCLISEAEEIGLKTANEVFADRTYQKDGSLTPRSKRNALIDDTTEAVKQVLQMINEQTVTATTAETVPIKAETICIHGDGKNAVEFAKNINGELKRNRVGIERP